MLVFVTLTVLGVTYNPAKPITERGNFDKQLIHSETDREVFPDKFKPLQTASLIAVEKKETPAQVSVPSGSHQDWMAAAGISQADYGYVDFIISHESGWIPNRVNASSGACGLVQSLPCSKLGSNWSDPVTALKWGDNYAKNRYGSWSKAHAFWTANKWW